MVAAVTALPSPGAAAQHVQGMSLLGDRDLGQIGVYRQSQVLTLLETMSWTTVSGFDRQPTSPGSVWEPSILLNGAPLAGSIFGRMTLSAVPLDPTRWDSVRVSQSPSVEWGEFRPEPVVNIVPRRPDTLFSAAAGAWVANGIGDPGPYQYLDSTLYNVERIGPGGHATVAYGADSWFLESHLLGRRHGLLSPFVTPRLNRLYSGPHQTPRMRTASVFLRTGLDLEHSRFEGHAFRAVTDDFLFLEAVGYEIPTQLQTSGVQARGSSTIGTDVDVVFGVSHSGLETMRRPGSRLDWSLDWREARTDVFGEVLVGSAKVGAAFTRQHGSGPGMGDGESIHRPAVYASGTLTFPNGVNQTAGVHVTFGDKLAPVIWAATTFRPSGDVRLDASASAGYRLFSQRPSLWYWHARGYDLADRAGLRITRFDPSTRTTFGTLRLKAEAALTPALTVSGETVGSAASDLNLAEHRFQTEPASDELIGTVILDGAASGGVWGGTLAVEHHAFERLFQRIAYAYSVPLGSASYRRLVAAKPRHRIAATALFVPNDRFSLAAVARVESATRWHAYAEAAATSDLYVDRLPTRFGLDLTVFKRLWGSHLDAGLTVRNVLGRELRYHPLGVDHPTILSVRLVLRVWGE